MSPNITNSTTVDERVVEMRIDNSKFEDGAKKTIGILEKLDKALHLHAETDEIDKLNRSIGNFDVSPMANGLDSLKSHFSALEIAGMRVISNLTDSVYNFTARTIKDLTIEPVTAGWSKLEEKTQSVQTIMNSTGLSLEEVNKYLEDLMWYSDETSFGFTDMTTALATMTSTGGDIKKLIPMIMGIGNAVAYSGKGAAEFKRSIMNLNQSYSGGYLTLMDWRSLQLAGTNSKALMETIIKTAEEMGKIEKGSITAANFTEKLKDQWADQEVMERAFGYFAEMSVTAKELIDEGVFDNAYEAYDYLAEQFDDVQSKAAKAAQECKSFKDVLDALKDAASTGWMTTFEHIFGNFEQQKELWGEVYDRLEQVFVTGGRTRNTILELALGTGQEIKQTLDDIEASDALAKLASQTEALREPIAGGIKSWEDFMHYFTATGATGHELGWALSEIEAATKQGVHFDHQLGDISWSLEDLEQAFKSGKIPIEDYIAAIEILSDKEILAGNRQLAYAAETGTIDQLGKSFWEKQTDGIVKYLVELGRADEVEKKMQQARALGWDEDWILENWEKPLQKYREEYDKILNKPVTMPAVSQATKEMQAAAETRKEGYQMLVEGLLNLLDHLVVVINTVRDAYETVFGTVEIRAQRLKGAIEIFHSFTEQIGFSEEALVGVQKVIEIIFAGVKLLGKVAGGVFTLLWRIIWPIANVIDDIFAMIGQSSFSVDNLIKSLEKRFSDLWPAIDSIANAFGFLFSVLFDLVGLVGGGLYVAFTNVLNIAGPIGNVIQFIADKISSFTKSLQRFGKYLKEGFKRNGFLGALETFFTGLRIEVKTTFPQLYGWFTRISDFFKNSQVSISEFFSNFNLFENLPSAFQSGLIGLGGLFSVVFGGFLTLVTGVLQGLQGVNFDTEKISESFNNFYEIVKLVFNGLFGDPTEFKERITNFVLEAWSGFKAALEQISIRDAIKALRLSFLFAIGAKIMSVLSMVKKIGDEAATIPESISWSIKRGGKLLDDIGKSFQANALIKMAAAVIMVSMALYGLSKINEDKLTHAAAVISVVMIILTMLVNSTRKATVLKNVDIKKFQVFGTVGSALIGLGVAIAAFTYAVFKIANAENPNRLLVAALAIIAFVGIITLIIGFFAAKLVKSNANWERLKNIGMIMSRLGGAFISISLAVGMLILPILALTAAAAILEKNNLATSNVWNSVISIMGIIIMLGAAVGIIMKSIDKLDDNQIKALGTALLKIGGSIFVISLAINAFMLPFFALAAACVVVYHYKQTLNPIWQALAIFGIIFAGLAGLIIGMSLILSKKTMTPERIKALGQTLLRMSASITLIGIGMNKMVNAFLKILVVTSVLKHFNMDVDFKTAGITLAVIAGGILAIVAILAKISTMKGLSAKKLLGLAAVITALGVAFLFVTPVIIGLGAVIAVLVYVASSLKNFDDVVRNMRSLAWTLVGISLAATFFGLAMLGLGVGALAASVSIGILALAFLAVARGIDALAVHQDKLVDLFNKLKKFFSLDNVWQVAKMTGALLLMIGAILALTKLFKWVAVGIGLLSKTSFTTDKLSASLGKFGKNIPKLLHGAFTKTTTYLTTHADDIIPALGLILTIIGGYLTGLMPTLATQLVAAIVALLESLAKEIKAKKTRLIDSLSDIARTIVDILGGILKNVFGSGAWREGNFWENAIRAILGGTGIIKLATILLNLFVPISKLIRDIKGGNVASAAVNVGSAVVGAATGATTGYVGKHDTGTYAGEASAIGEAVSTAVGDSVGEAISNATESFLGSILGPLLLIGVTIAGLWAAFHATKTILENSEKHQKDIADTIDKLLKENPNPDDHPKVVGENLDIIRSAKTPMQLHEIRQLNPEDRASTGASQFAFDSYTRTMIANIREAEAISEAFLQTMAEDLGGFLSTSDAKKLVSKYSSVDSESNVENIKADILKYYDGYINDFIEILHDGLQLGDKETESLVNRINDLSKYYETGNINEILGYFEQINSRLSFKDFIDKIQGTELDLLDALTLVDLLPDQTFLDTSVDKLINYNNKIKQSNATVDEINEFSDMFNISLEELSNLVDATGLSISSIIKLANVLPNEFSSMTPEDLVKAYNLISEAAYSFDDVHSILRSYGMAFSDVTQKMAETGISFEDIMWLLEEYGKITVFSNNNTEELNDLLSKLKEQKRKAEIKAEEEKRLIEEAQKAKDEKIEAIKESVQSVDEAVITSLSEGDYKGAATTLASSIAPNLINPDEIVAAIDMALNGHPEIADILNRNIEASGLGKNINDAVHNAVENGIDTTKLTEVIGGSIKEASSDPALATEMKTALLDIGKYLPEGAAEGVTGNLTPFLAAITSMSNKGIDLFSVLNLIGSPSKVYEDLAKWIPIGVYYGIKNHMSAAIQGVENMVHHMQRPFQNIQSRFQNFGVQAVRGVVIGINNNANAAYNAGVNLANAVNRGYSNTLKIKSPSRVFEALSMYVPMGAANGIMKGIPIAVAAASDLGNAIADEAAYAMSNMAYVASDQYDFRPSITPVVDLNSAYSGMDNLERILADNPLSMSVRPTSQRQMPQYATNYTFSNQNKDVVAEIHRLNDRMTKLGEDITNMKIVLNSGILVGEMAPAMNRELGTIALRERRQ